MTDPTSGLETLAKALQTYFIPLVAASALTMALLEAVKKLLSLRGRYHRQAVQRWLAEHAHNLPAHGPGARLDPLVLLHGDSQYNLPGAKALPVGAAARTLVQGLAQQRYQQFGALTTGLQPAAFSLSDDAGWRFRSIDRAVFELETSRMMSQVQDAADVVLNNPTTYEALYSFLTRGCDPQDVADWRRFLHDAAEGKVPPPEQQKAQADRYGRLRLAVRRQLDAFQSVTQMRWDDLNQLWAVAVGAVILLLAQLIVAGAKPIHPLLAAEHPWLALKAGWATLQGVEAHLALLLSSLLGGALAPVAKDLVDALAKLKFGK